ncbi:hypothetical protein KGM_209053 [Danaus plexippus plexippus]|uniref:Uncharacterized protein n=1 Tax=Danaus plexippus plexippus TaxID=278856 RepID=A0A212FCT7_DANPL|nr:hypothetical protein KGM_209053 [Danaus plexippus plexippus]
MNHSLCRAVRNDTAGFRHYSLSEGLGYDPLPLQREESAHDIGDLKHLAYYDYYCFAIEISSIAHSYGECPCFCCVAKIIELSSCLCDHVLPCCGRTWSLQTADGRMLVQVVVTTLVALGVAPCMLQRVCRARAPRPPSAVCMHRLKINDKGV